jgi:hypothetical protein
MESEEEEGVGRRGKQREGEDGVGRRGKSEGRGGRRRE